MDTLAKAFIQYSQQRYDYDRAGLCDHKLHSSDQKDGLGSTAEGARILKLCGSLQLRLQNQFALSASGLPSPAKLSCRADDAAKINQGPCIFPLAYTVCDWDNT